MLFRSVKSVGAGAGADCGFCSISGGPLPAAAAPGAGPAAPGATGVWAEHTAEPAHRARVVTNPNRFMNCLPARVLLEVSRECRFAERLRDRLPMNGPCRSATGVTKLKGQATSLGIRLQYIIEAVDFPPGSL